MITKPKLLLVARTSYHFRILRDCGTLDLLKTSFDLNFLYMEAKVATTNSTDELQDLAEYGKNFSIKFSKGITGKIKYLYFHFRAFLNMLAYFLNEISNNRSRLRFSYLVSKTLSVEGPQFILLAKLFVITKTIKPIALMLKGILRVFVPNYFHGVPKPDLVFIMYNSYNIMGFIDDIIRQGRRSKIKTFGLQMNWDNIPDRIPLEVPSFLGVYGEQAFLIAACLHNISPYRIYPVGSIKFDIYRSKLPSREESRQKLGLPLEGKLVAICPTGEGYDELFILRTLNDAVENGELPSNVHFYFKGYQFGKKKTMESLFRLEEGREAEDLELKNVTFWDPETCELKGNDFYPAFFSAIDCIISAFSTMVLEANICGIPAMVMDYNPKNYGSNNYYDWSATQYNYHLYAIRNSDTTVLCESRESLIDDTKKLLLHTNIPGFGDLCKLTASTCVYIGQKSASERLVEFLLKSIKSDFRDFSFRRYI